MFYFSEWKPPGAKESPSLWTDTHMDWGEGLVNPLFTIDSGDSDSDTEVR